MSGEFGKDGNQKWERWNPPYFWQKVNNYVVADRHLPDGTRQHMLKGNGPSGLVIDNAEIVWEDSEEGRNAEFLMSQ